MQVVGDDVVFPDLPAGLFFLVLVVFERAAHRKHDLAAIGRDIDILDVVGVAASNAVGDIALDGGGRGAVTEEQVRVGFRIALLVQAASSMIAARLAARPDIEILFTICIPVPALRARVT
jgi:hypothetical protein